MQESVNTSEVMTSTGATPQQDLKFKIGSIVSTHAHPYGDALTDVVITAYSYFTPPLMLVVEIKKGREYDLQTGIKDDHSYKCLYYSGKDGKFVQHWFKGRELKRIMVIDQSDPIKRKWDVRSLLSNYLGHAAILKTVDLELGKIKSWADTTNQVIKWKESNLLDFLPPLGTVIGIRKSEDHTHFSKKTGKKILEKPIWLFKLRWLNNATGSFSEEEIPVDALKFVTNEELQPKRYSESEMYWYKFDEPLSFEKSNIKMYKIPVIFKRIIWKHYHYLYHFKSLVSNEEFVLDRNRLTQISKTNNDTILPWYKSNIYETGASNFFSKDIDSLKGRWFDIHYRDKTNKKTRRIIHVINVEIKENTSGNNSAIISANCLLREGGTRHFYSNRIDFYRDVPDFFQQIITPAPPPA